jgi:hypothetical protein
VAFRPWTEDSSVRTEFAPAQTAASEAFDLNSSEILWLIGILAALFVALVAFEAVRLLRSGRDGEKSQP